MDSFIEKINWKICAGKFIANIEVEYLKWLLRSGIFYIKALYPNDFLKSSYFFDWKV